MTDTPPNPEKNYIIVHETVAESWIKDVWTFGCIGALAWFNHAFVGGSWPVDLLAIVAVVSQGASAVFRRKTYTRDELRAWALSEDRAP